MFLCLKLTARVKNVIVILTFQNYCKLAWRRPDQSNFEPTPQLTNFVGIGAINSIFVLFLICTLSIHKQLLHTNILNPTFALILKVPINALNCVNWRFRILLRWP